jgi:transmembrane sensor
MDNKELPSISSSSEQALEWFTRLEDTPVKVSVQQEFLNWYAENPENQLAYDKIAKLWGSEVFVQALQIEEQRINHKKSAKARRLMPGLAIAATLLLGVWGVFQSNMLQRLSADQYTTVGQQHKMVLSDGSSVILDTDSAISVSYNQHSRNITLLTGRAFFNVLPDTNRPFIVNTDEEHIRVVGTRFTVNSETNKPLTVQQGRVSYRPDNSNKEITVIAGEHLQKTQNQPDVIKTDPTTLVFAWTDGRIKFHNQPLVEIIAEIDRYQPGLILISKPSLASIRVSGNYKLNDPDKIITALAKVTGAKVIQLSNYLTVIH